MLTQAPKGTKDIAAPEIYVWQWLENILREVSHLYGASEIRTPIFEHTELFIKNVGDTSDIVNKEMYTFNDKGGRSLTLRPEGTAGAARSFVEHKIYANPQPTKYYYMSKFFRYEKPQAGRYREFSQFGYEVLGSYSPAVDAEVIAFCDELFRRIGVEGIEIHLNSIGGEASRKAYNTKLKEYIGSNFDDLCPSCKERYERNPLRALDCKVPQCGEIMSKAPSVLDYLVEEDKAHFEKVKDMLTEMGIQYTVDPKMVRGLDYYTKTVFEFVSGDIGAQSTVCGGGRYDKVIEQTGGPEMGACGFAFGIDRIMLLLENTGKLPQFDNKRDIFIGSIGEKGSLKSKALVNQLRKCGVSADSDLMDRSVKAQLKYADKLGSRFSVILGDTEIETNKANIKNMETGEVTEVELDKIAEFLGK